MTPAELTKRLKDEAARLGFALAGACPAVTPQGLHHFHAWLAAGFAGEMHYLPQRRAAYEHPSSVLGGARSLLLLALNYRSAEPQPPGPGYGRISRYAWGSDYHDLIHERLKQLSEFLRRLVPGASVRGVVDTAPLLESEFAQLAGLGWIGKNTLVLNRQLGSWFFLAVLVTDVELVSDEPHVVDHCGTCRACIDACPTEALVEPYRLDARKCISYLTIELRGPMPRELRTGVGDWVQGCDICQDVCPWNQRSPVGNEAALAPREDLNPLELASLFDLDEEAFRTRFRHTPLWRPKRRGILRNAAIVLGNQRQPGALEALVKGLNDVEPLVRGASAWALGQLGGVEAQSALAQRTRVETDLEVIRELAHAASSQVMVEPFSSGSSGG